MQGQDSQILENLRGKPESSLRALYKAYYSFVCSVVYKMIGDASQAEDVAQEVFLEVWSRRDSLDVNLSLRGYLRKVAVNKTLNHIRKKKMNFAEEEEVFHIPSSDNSSQKVLEAQDLQGEINKAIESLPERCRMIFAMSRFEELSYREIAEKLNISIKTVENQMSKALKSIRAAVFEYQTEN